MLSSTIRRVTRSALCCSKQYTTPESRDCFLGGSEAQSLKYGWALFWLDASPQAQG
jgi:hypothetical protein